MSAWSNRSVKKIGVLEWLLIGYVLIGFAWAGVCLSFDGDARFPAFVVYGLYAFPTIFIVSIMGFGDALFGIWPTAIYWTAALVVVNGFAIYALAKIGVLGWRRSSKPRFGDSAR
jgi:hypothetical protein